MFYQLLNDISQWSIIRISKRLRDKEVILMKNLYYDKENHQKVSELNIKS